MDAYPGALYTNSGIVGIVIIKTDFKSERIKRFGISSIVGSRCSLELVNHFLHPGIAKMYLNDGIVRGESTETFECNNV